MLIKIFCKQTNLNYHDHIIYRDIETNVIVGNADVASINDENQPGAVERYMVVRGSMKSKLPQALIIKSANLRVLDPIGQGLLNGIIHAYVYQPFFPLHSLTNDMVSLWTFCMKDTNKNLYVRTRFFVPNYTFNAI